MGSHYANDPRDVCRWCGKTEDCDCGERINCPDEGKPGHNLCGWCDEHDEPRWLCFHFHAEERFRAEEARRQREIEEVERG